MRASNVPPCCVCAVLLLSVACSFCILIIMMIFINPDPDSLIYPKTMTRLEGEGGLGRSAVLVAFIYGFIWVGRKVVDFGLSPWQRYGEGNAGWMSLSKLWRLLFESDVISTHGLNSISIFKCRTKPSASNSAARP
jgi:hypothetical protein